MDIEENILLLFFIYHGTKGSKYKIRFFNSKNGNTIEKSEKYYQVRGRYNGLHIAN
jgi:hypothetical protein